MAYEMGIKILKCKNEEEMSAALSLFLKQNVTISTVISAGKIVGIKITNDPELMSLSCKRRYFKKAKSLRIKLLKTLHERAAEKHCTDLEKSFQELCNKYFSETGINALERVRRAQTIEAMKSPKESTLIIEDKPVKSLEAAFRRGPAKIKRHIINLFK